jgi:hypothetical protein
MTTSDYPTRTTVLLDTVHEHDHEHEHDMNHEMDHKSSVRPMVSLKKQINQMKNESLKFI